MNQLLYERSTGNLGPNALARLVSTRQLNAFQATPQFRFDGSDAVGGSGSSSQPLSNSQPASVLAHQAGVNALALERFDGRLLISGGSDASIKLWDLEQCGSNQVKPFTFQPVAQIRRLDPKAHRFGLTHLSFYPFDAAAFLSSSYDKTLKLWATEGTRLSGSFELGAKVYTHAISPIAGHLTVACGTQHPSVRLVDLRTGSAIQSLIAPGQVTGAVLSVAWSPRHEHVLASGSVDGTVRIWDIRRASGLVALLDQEDSLGIVVRGRGTAGAGDSLADRGIRSSAKAHSGPVNGLTWTDNGNYIVSAGHDRKIRVWDAATGANTLASFGPSIRNGGLGSVTMFASPNGLTPPMEELLFWPNETEILVLGLHTGRIVTRLRVMGASAPSQRAQHGGDRTSKQRVMNIVWRGAGGVGGSSGVVMGGRNAVGGIYSAHLDGQIRAWMPHVHGDDDDDQDDDDPLAKEEAEQKAKKRKALDDAYKSLMGRQITFS